MFLLLYSSLIQNDNNVIRRALLSELYKNVQNTSIILFFKFDHILLEAL